MGEGPTPSGGEITYVDCGSRVLSNRVGRLVSVCGLVRYACSLGATLMTPAERAAETTQASVRGGNLVAAVQCDIPRGHPIVDGEMARESAERLLPHPGIGTAPAGNVTLVNIETLLWVQTPVDRTLGTVSLLGQSVTLRAHVQAVHWDFGDGVTGESATPGKPYTDADPCRTVQCPDYFGHTYRHSGAVMIGAQLIWTGDFRVGAGPWQPITGTVAAPATSETVRVKQARAVLVPNP